MNACEKKISSLEKETEKNIESRKLVIQRRSELEKKIEDLKKDIEENNKKKEEKQERLEKRKQERLDRRNGEADSDSDNEGAEFDFNEHEIKKLENQIADMEQVEKEANEKIEELKKSIERVRNEESDYDDQIGELRAQLDKEKIEKERIESFNEKMDFTLAKSLRFTQSLCQEAFVTHGLSEEARLDEIDKKKVLNSLYIKGNEEMKLKVEQLEDQLKTFEEIQRRGETIHDDYLKLDQRKNDLEVKIAELKQDKVELNEELTNF